MPSNLSVNKESRKASKSTEGRQEKRVAQILSDFGLFSYHTADRFTPGVPDRYMVGGTWIEFKILACRGNRPIFLTRGFTPAQKNWLKNLHDKGDFTFGCIFVYPEVGDPRMILRPWWYLAANPKWDAERIHLEGVEMNTRLMRDECALHFGPEHARYVNVERYLCP